MTVVRVARIAAVVLLAVGVLALEWAWRNHTLSILESRDGKCVMVGASVDNGRVPVVSCASDGARRVAQVVAPSASCPAGAQKVKVRTELSHDTGYIGALCLTRP
ncbi:LppU/SCO3897 family protein [Acidipropionibacterium timonense]|uniref:LppU/SCO3897 family protein n=1 Tax=Acidipropionibacterium timonense TaxID=2161818 RepID=UPI001030F1C5|nr:hypothetical protein [Acidipropionibacterium timonense]